MINTDLIVLFLDEGPIAIGNWYGSTWYHLSLSLT